MAPRHGGDPGRFGLRPGDVVDFSANLNPLGPPPAAVAAARAAPVDAYPEPYAANLARALAERHGLPAGAVAVGAGATELLYLVARLAAGRRVRLPVPAFSEYEPALRAHGARIERVLLPVEAGFRPQLDRCAGEACLVGNPNNPTGVLLATDEVLWLAERCSLLVVDESLIDFADRPEEASVLRLAASRPGLWVLRSLTKWYAMPGLRAGFAVGRPEDVARLDAERDPWSVSTPAQAAALAALADRDHDRRTRAWIAEARPALRDALSGLSGYRCWPPAANFILAQAPQPAEELRRQLLGVGLLIRGPEGFAGLDARCFRVAVRTAPDNARLLAALGGRA